VYCSPEGRYEDIGNENKTNYLPEMDRLADVGSAGTGPLFARMYRVGTSGRWSEICMGSNDTRAVKT
jgi:hypothetical protein